MTAAGRILGFVLMIYAIGIFTYLIGSVASVLVASTPAEQRSKEIEASN